MKAIDDLCERMAEEGIHGAIAEDGNSVGFRTHLSAPPLCVRWTAGELLVRLIQPVVLDAGAGAPAHELARVCRRIDRESDVLAVVIDEDGGWIGFRTHVTTAADGTLDFDVFAKMLSCFLDEIAAYAPLVRAAAAAGESNPFSFYVD